MFIYKAVSNIKNMNRCLYQCYLINVRYNSDKSNSRLLQERIFRKDLLLQHLGIPHSLSSLLLRSYPHINDVENKTLEESLNTLNRLGFDTEDICKSPMVLTLHYNTIEHCVMYLREAGITDISANLLLRFRSNVRKPVGLLKAHGIISENVNVPERLYSFLTPKPPQFPLLDTFTDEDSIVYIHEAIFRQYLEWLLETTKEEVDRIFKIYDEFKYRSFRIMSNMIDILTNELHFSKEKLKGQSYLLKVNPEYPRQIMKLFPTIATRNIKFILHKHPKVIAVPPSSIQLILNHLKKFDVPDEALRNCFKIFTLSPDTVYKRLNQITQIPEFLALKGNKRFLRLVFHYNQAKLRLDDLAKYKVTSPSIHFLCAHSGAFKKFAFDGYDSNRGTDIVSYLSKIFNIPMVELRKMLNNNPHWCQVPLINIQDSLQFLTKKRISIQEISLIPVILLYSREVIDATLSELKTHPETCNLSLSPREKLNLCIYLIERKYRFSGNGVWENRTQKSANMEYLDNDDEENDISFEPPKTKKTLLKII